MESRLVKSLVRKNGIMTKCIFILEYLFFYFFLLKNAHYLYLVTWNLSTKASNDKISKEKTAKNMTHAISWSSTFYNLLCTVWSPKNKLMCFRWSFRVYQIYLCIPVTKNERKMDLKCDHITQGKGVTFRRMKYADIQPWTLFFSVPVPLGLKNCILYKLEN